MMPMADISKKTDIELTKLLLEKQEALRVFRFGISGSKARNVKEGRNIRKEISRIKTALNQMKTT